MTEGTGGNRGNRGPGLDGGSEARPEDDREDHAVEKLLYSLRDFAKTEAAEMAAVPPQHAPGLSAAERGDIAAAILAAGSAEGASGAAGSGGSVTSIDRVRRRRRTTWLAVGLPVAAAAGLVLALGPLSRPDFPALPAYEVSAMGGIKEMRSGESGALAPRGNTATPERIGRRMELVVVGRPDTAVEGPVAARVFFVQGTMVREASPRVETAPSGSVELRVRPADAGIEGGGRWLLRALVGRPEAIREAAPAEAAGSPVDGAGRRWLTVPLDVVE